MPSGSPPQKKYYYDSVDAGPRSEGDRIGDDMLLTRGTRLGPYEIESLIGSGGMGEVYKAHDGRLNRTVAIKRMIADDVSRFQSEARAIAAINHPHICQIYDVGPDYLVLEYLQGSRCAVPSVMMRRCVSRARSLTRCTPRTNAASFTAI